MLKENFESSKIQASIQGLCDLMCLSSSAFITSAIDSGDEVIWGPGSLSLKGGLSIQKDPCQGSISSACSNILSAWVIRRAGAIHIIESPSLSKEIIWSACHSWVHNSTLWWCACGAQWFSGILFSSPGQTGERWLRFYEAYWASGEPRLNEGCSALPGRLTPSGLIVCGVSGQRSAFVCGHRGHGGAFVGGWGDPVAASGAIEPCIHLAQQLEEEISTQEIMQRKQDSYDYFITLISFGIIISQEIGPMCLQPDKAACVYSLLNIAPRPCPPIHLSFISEAFPRCLPRPPPSAEGKGGYETPVEPAELVHYQAFLPLTHFPYCLRGLTPAREGGKHGYVSL